VTLLRRFLLHVAPSLERSLWLAERRYRATAADAIVASTGKSGRTWLRIMMSHVYHRRFGIPANEIFAFANLHRMNPAIPKIYFGFGEVELPPAWPWQKPMLAPLDKPIVFLTRDPRDVTVSFHFHLNNRATARELVHKDVVAQRRSLPLATFMMDEVAGLPRIIRRYNDWYERLRLHPKARVVRYEDMRSTPERELAGVMAHLGQSFDADDIRAAVAFASFESLQEKERQRFFTAERIRRRDDGDPDAFKVRRGKVGGYRDYFDERQLDAIDRLVQDRLVPDWGYSVPSADRVDSAASTGLASTS
jgi:hypothetical protein